jgi:hypothetical protein
MTDSLSSERFIHDELLRRAETGLPGIKDAWRKYKRLDPFLISWPSEHITCDDGTVVTDYFTLDLPRDKKRWSGLFIQTIEKTVPYALLLAEELEDHVSVIFESVHGTRSWHFPIKQQGNVRVLGKPTSRDDTDRIGVLWAPNKHES